MDKNKEILMGHEGRLRVKKGIDRAADAVRPTLGVIGMSAMIEYPGLDPIECDDGVTILKNLKFKDKYENLGLQKIRKAALRTSSEGGDGTATTTVLTQALVSEAFKEIANDSSKIREVRERLEKGLQETLAELTKIKRDVKDEDIEKIALISSLDPEVAKIIAEIVREVGVHGIINVEKGSELGYSKEVTPGAKFDKGYITEYFVNNQEDKTSILINPFIALVNRKISLGEQIKKIMNEVAKTENKSILFIADDVDGIGLASLIQSSKNVKLFDPQTKEIKTGTYDVCAVRNPFNASPAREFLGDMAALTGAKVIDETAGMRMDNQGIEVLGMAEKVIVTQGTCTIIGGKGSLEGIRARANEIKQEIASTTSEFEKARLKERLAKLEGGIGIIRVGAYTDTDYNAKKYKFDNAIAATQAALQEGIVAGGGSALAFIARLVKEPMFQEVLAIPIKQMATNAGLEWTNIPTKKNKGTLRFTNIKDMGCDFKAEGIVNMFDAGIIDPFKVIRLALESATYIASTLIDKETFIVTIDEEKNVV